MLLLPWKPRLLTILTREFSASHVLGLFDNMSSLFCERLQIKIDIFNSTKQRHGRNTGGPECVWEGVNTMQHALCNVKHSLHPVAAQRRGKMSDQGSSLI